MDYYVINAPIACRCGLAASKIRVCKCLPHSQENFPSIKPKG